MIKYKITFIFLCKFQAIIRKNRLRLKRSFLKFTTGGWCGTKWSYFLRIEFNFCFIFVLILSSYTFQHNVSIINVLTVPCFTFKFNVKRGTVRTLIIETLCSNVYSDSHIHCILSATHQQIYDYNVIHSTLCLICLN